MILDSYSVTVYNNFMQEDSGHLTLEELAEQTELPVRTIRYYITEGLLPGPEGRGKAAAYSEEHILRLRLIRLLSQQHMPLAEMHRLLNRLSLIELRTLLAEEEQQVREKTQVRQSPSPQEYIGGLLKKAQATRPESAQNLPARAPDARKASSPPDEEIWRRWEMVPGIELHIKVSVEEQHRSLIERICKIAGIPFYPFNKK